MPKRQVTRATASVIPRPIHIGRNICIQNLMFVNIENETTQEMQRWEEHVSKPVRSFAWEKSNITAVKTRQHKERGDNTAVQTHSLQFEGNGYRTVVVCLFGAFVLGVEVQPSISKRKGNCFYVLANLLLCVLFTLTYMKSLLGFDKETHTIWI